MPAGRTTSTITDNLPLPVEGFSTGSLSRVALMRRDRMHRKQSRR